LKGGLPRRPVAIHGAVIHAIGGTSASGIARNIAGDPNAVSDFAAASANRTEFQVLVNIMHELGHTLGLRHGGQDGHNHKVNQLSVMNYSWSAGVYFQDPTHTSGARYLDYSRMELPVSN